METEWNNIKYVQQCLSRGKHSELLLLFISSYPSWMLGRILSDYPFYPILSTPFLEFQTPFPHLHHYHSALHISKPTTGGTYSYYQILLLNWILNTCTKQTLGCQWSETPHLTMFFQMRIWRSQVFLWALSQRPWVLTQNRRRFSLCLDSITVLELWRMVSKRRVLSLIFIWVCFRMNLYWHSLCDS